MFLFELAERLSMTVGELIDRMSSAELSMWESREQLIIQEREKQERLAKMRANRRT